MKANTKQYTIRNVPRHVDEQLHRRARESGKSFNQVAVEALSEGAGQPQMIYDDLDFMIGSLSERDAAALAREISAQDRVNADLWR